MVIIKYLLTDTNIGMYKKYQTSQGFPLFIRQERLDIEFFSQTPYSHVIEKMKKIKKQENSREISRSCII